MEPAAYEKIMIEDPEFPVVVLENNKPAGSLRQQLCPLHWHEHLELHYILEGSLEAEVNHTHYLLHAGDLLVINGSDTHCSYSPGLLQERILIFRPEALSRDLTVPAFQRCIQEDGLIRQLMDRFEAEYTHPATGSLAVCKSKLLELSVHLARNYALSPASHQEYRRHKQQLRRLQPVQAYIALHYWEPLDSGTLAELIYLSKDRFHHLFKECMGIPLRKYINDLRLHTAYGWLQKGLYPPMEAAARAGFSDYNYFGRLFRQTFGCTPSQVEIAK